MSGQILVSCGPGERRIAYVVDDCLHEYALWRPSCPDSVGDFYRGRVASVVPGLAGAFILLPQKDGDPATGFLPDSATSSAVQEGDSLVVHVTRAPQAGKGARLSAKLTAAQRVIAEQTNAEGRIALGPDPLARLIARFPTAPVVVDEASVAAAIRAQGIQPALSSCAFDDWLEDEIDVLASSIVETPEGGRFSIYPTPALVAIDLDAGRQVADGGDTSRLHWQANQRLIPVLARQIRLRNLSGAILVDFAGLSPKKRQGLRQTLEDALAGDPLKPRLLGFTGLGLAEIVRNRVQPPLHELLNTPLSKGLAALRRALREAPPTGDMIVTVSANVAAALRADPDALPFCERKRGYTVTLQVIG